MEQIINSKKDLNNNTNINQVQQTNYVVYVLVNTIHNKTYIGITNNTIRRLRQHNGELVGGAKYTTSNKNLKVKTFPPASLTNLVKPNLLSSILDFESKDSKLEGSWIYYGFIKNLHKNLALSLEKKIKIKSKKISGTFSKKSLDFSKNLDIYPRTPIEKRLKAIEKVLEEYNLLFNTNYQFEKLVIT